MLEISNFFFLICSFRFVKISFFSEAAMTSNGILLRQIEISMLVNRNKIIIKKLYNMKIIVVILIAVLYTYHMRCSNINFPILFIPVKRRYKGAYMDKAVILHISDLHFGISEANVDNPKQTYVSDRQTETLDGFFTSLKNLIDNEPEWKPQIVVISGDIGWQGAKNDYDLYRENFVTRLVELLGIEKENIITCPGNHDIIRKKVERINRHPKDSLEQGVPELTKEEMILEADFFENYVEELCDNDPAKICQAITTEDYPWITFLTLNSAWDCRKEPDEGRLRVGLKIMEDLLHNVPSGNCLITIFHHPHTLVHDIIPKEENGSYSFQKVDRQWLHISEREPKISGDRTFGSYVEDKSTYILNGHIHKATAPESVGNAIRLISGTVYSNDTPQYHCRLLKIYQRKTDADEYRDIRHNIGSQEEVWEITTPLKIKRMTTFERNRKNNFIHDIINILNALPNRGKHFTEDISHVIEMLLDYIGEKDDTFIRSSPYVTDNLKHTPNETKEKSISEYRQNIPK